MGLFNNDDEEDTPNNAAAETEKADTPVDPAAAVRLRTDQSPPPSSDDTDTSAAPSAPVRSNPVVDYITKKYGLGSSSDVYNKMSADGKTDLKAARDQANDNKGNIGIAQGIATMFGARPNDGFYNSLRNNEDQKLGQATADRQQMIKDYLTSRQLGTEDTNQAQKEKVAAFTNTENQRTQDLQTQSGDPDSAVSTAKRKLYKAVMPPEIANDPSYDSLSADQLDKGIAEPAKLYTEMKARQSQMAIAAQNHADLMANANRRMSDSEGNHSDAMGNVASKSDADFASKYNVGFAKHNADAAKLDKVAGMIDLAGKSDGGIAGSLARAGELHEALGRVTQSELPMASDPAMQNKIEGFYNKLTTGQTITDKDVLEYRNILSMQKAAADAAWQKSSDSQIYGYAKARHGGDVNAVQDLVRPPPAAGAAPAQASGGGYPKVVTNGTHTATVTNADDEKAANAKGFK